MNLRRVVALVLCGLVAQASRAVSTNRVTVDSRGTVRFGACVLLGKGSTEPIKDSWMVVGDTPEAALAYLRAERHASRAALARAEKLIRAELTRPYIAVEPTPVAVPLDELIEVPVLGTAIARGFRIARVEPPIVDAAPTEDQAALRITGRLPGRAMITITRDGLSLDVPLVVVPRAARRLSEISLQVTGEPTADQLAQAAAAIAEPLLERPPGTRLTVTPTEPSALRLRASGGDAAPTDDLVVYRTERVSFEHNAASRVLPGCGSASGSVVAPGLLGRMAVVTEATYRAVSWQVNSSGEPLAIQARLANAGGEPARVWMNLAATGPTDNAIWAGHKASREYLRAKLAEAGVFVTVPPRSVWVVCSREAKSGQGVGWLGDLRLVSGADVEWQVLALPPDSARLGPQPLPPDSQPREPAPLVQAAFPERLTEVITSDDATRVVETTCGEAEGTAGVRYRFTLLLTNPSGVATPWGVAISPVAGQAQVAFEVDGKLVETPLLTPDGPFVWIQPLEPGEQRAVHLSLVLPTGSSLPLRLRVGPFALIAAP
ncbi:MAG: hypothetical protein HZB16_13510 [Armatimonadetes bacterium]|nr:hypothetical protein [Armatimonadota bacterium]